MSELIQQPATAPAAKRPLWLLRLALAVVLVVATVVLFLALSGRLTPYTPEVTGRPAIRVSQDFFDFGDLKMGEQVETRITVKNVGDQPLNLITPYVELIEGCCAPIAQITQQTLGPGEEATILIPFGMAGDSGGPHEFLAHIQSNDPETPDQQVRILSNWVE